MKDVRSQTAIPPPKPTVARRQMKRLLDEAVATLPSLYRTVYELRDIEDRPGDEVAQKLGISRAAMKSRIAPATWSAFISMPL